jgi:hypothetical protein
LYKPLLTTLALEYHILSKKLVANLWDSILLALAGILQLIGGWTVWLSPRRPKMNGQYALLSIVYMMSFVVLFDRVHYKRRLGKWLSGALMSAQELERMMALWSVCQEPN